MENTFDFSSLALYMLKTVQVHFKDSSVKRGILSPSQGTILLDGNSYAFDSIADIEYVAEVDDFHTYKGFGEIGKVRFSVDDLHPDFNLSDLLYGEFVCIVSCHLYLKDMEMCAKDIRLVEKRHKLNYECAKAKTLLYKYDDSTIAIGTLSGDAPDYCLKTPDGNSVPLELNRIVEITKAPEENDYIYAALSTDSAEHCGLVSAVNGTMVILITPEGNPDFLDLTHATSIRYRGIVYLQKALVNGKTKNKVMIATGTSRGDNDYLCKLPYSRDPDDIKRVKDGDEVSFVPGINDRYFIAKDVDVVRSGPKPEPVIDAVSESEYYGIILTVDFSRENGYGYVGNRFVSKACGKAVPGHARFTRNQLNFNIEYNKAYIVKYIASEDPQNNLRIISQLTLHQVLDATKYGIIEVLDDGAVNAVPLYKAGITYFENRDIDVHCVDGNIVSGRLRKYNESEISVVKGLEDDTDATVISFADIDDIRIVGTVSQFYQNGTGYVDNAFFFHINEMEQSVDAQYVRRGTQVSFCLRNARKGNHVDCGSIRILPEKRIDVYVIGYQNQSYTVIDADKYGRDIRFTDNAYEVPYSLYNQFGDLDNEDYHAILTIQRKNGVDQCTSIRTLDGRPKLRYGIVTALSRDNNTVSIVSPADYRKKSQAATFTLSQQGESNRISNSEKNDYPVLYYTQMQSGVIVATITWVDLKNIRDKCFFGYLEQYIEDKSFGWIVPDAYLGTPWNKEQRVHCKPSSFVEAPESYELCNSKFMFRVCYTLEMDSKISNYNPQPPAKQVWFLEKVERPQKATSAVSTTPAVPVPTTTAVNSSDVVLDEEYPRDIPDKTNWKYGIVTAFSPTFSSVRIFRNFRNKKKPGVSAEFKPEQLFTIEIPANIINIDYGDIEKINTVKSVYLVKYTTTEIDGQEQYDESQPLVFLKEYRKSTLKSLEIDSGILRIETIQPSVQTVAPAAKAELASSIATAYARGETIMVLTANQEYISGEFATIDGNTITFLDGRSVTTPESSVIRFGVLTSFDDAMTVGVINGNSSFLFANMEPKTFNIVKNAKRKMLLCYTCKNGVIDYVERISPELRIKMPMQWQLGKVSDYTVSNEERCIWVNDTVKCYLSVDTGGYIQSLVKTDNIITTVVFIKTVSCPVSQEHETVLGNFAFDIHCEREKSVIRYDAVTNRFLAARNAARSESVEGNHNYLLSLVDTEIEVFYRVSDDGRNLQAYIDSDDGVDEWTDEVVEDEELAASKALFNTSLVRYFIRKTDLRTLDTPNNITISEDGWPLNDAQAADLATYYLNRKTFEIDEAMAAIALLVRMPDDIRDGILSSTSSKSIEAILWRTLNRQVGIIGRSVNCVWGEYSYYENTILSDIHSLERQKEELFKYFLQDFYSRIEVMDILRKFKSRDRRKPRIDLQKLFRRNLIEDTAWQLVAHMLSLDEATVQHLIITENVLDGNDTIVSKIFEWGKRIDSTQEFDSVAALIDHLRSLYRSDKNRFLRELENARQNPNAIMSVEGILQIIRGRFVQLITEDDVQRFTTLQGLCRLIIDNKHAGFTKYRAALLEGWAKINDLIYEAEVHPTQETTEMLINTQILATIREEISSTLNELLSKREYMPDIRCESNGSEIIEGQKNLILLVANGEVGHTNRQSALNVKLILEVLSGLSNDSVPNEIVLSEKELLAGSPDIILDNIPFALDSLDGDAFSIAVSAEFECSIGFADKEIRETRITNCGILEFQLQTKETFSKDKNATNFYLHPSEGNPLKETDAADSNMFFGRKIEKAEIWNAIVDENLRLREGRAVMLYGQKKTGKTSLANQILGKIRNTKKVNDQAIIIRIPDIMEIAGGITELECFTLNFYQFILDAFELALYDHPDVEILLEENNLNIPDLTLNPMAVAALFQRFFRKFAVIDQGRHRVVLIIDEFTRLCTTLIDHPEYQQIPNFIKLFSGMGFIQIIIGHPNMMKALSTLGIINHTAEFSKRIELAGLKREDAVALIREPMIRSFGYDVYESPLGTRAIDMLLDLSGCHPSVLMKLCNEMFLHFISTDYPKIIHSDVNKMLEKYLDQLDPSTTFDIMVIEDGDVAEFFDNLPTYRYLKAVALQSLNYNNQDCDFNFTAEGLSLEENYNIRDTLLMRKVLIAGNGRIKIVTKLFLEYVRHKYKAQ